MIISKNRSFIFVAVPKTGTCSIDKALESQADLKLKRKFNKHATANKLKRDLPAQDWSKAFKFAFVRDPYAWMQSWYRFRKREPLKHLDHPLHHRYTGDMSLDDFVHGFAKKELMLNQTDFISTVDGQLMVDYVGRYETLQADFEQVCKKLGFASEKLPVLNVSKSSTSMDQPLDQQSINIINEYFDRDFQNFAYCKR